MLLFSLTMKLYQFSAIWQDGGLQIYDEKKFIFLKKLTKSTKGHCPRNLS